MTKMTTPIRSINLIENTKIRFFTKKGRKTDGGSGIRREVKIEADSKKETSDLHQKHSKEKFHLEDNYALKWLNRPSNLLNLVAPQWLQIWTFSSEKSVSAISELLFTVFRYKDRSPDRILRSCVSCVEKENEKVQKRNNTNGYDLTSYETNQNQSQPSISMRYFFLSLAMILALAIVRQDLPGAQ